MSCVCRKIVTCSVSPEVTEAVKQKIQAALMPFGQECLEKVDVQKNENTPKTRKKFRFADEDYEELEQVKFFDGDKKDNICPKEKLPSTADDVSSYLRSGSSWWCDDEVDRKLYQVNMKINMVDVGIAGVRDFGGPKKSISEIRKSRITHWQKFANPCRFLMGHLLTSPNPTSDFASIPAEVKADVKKMLTESIRGLSDGTIDVLQLYEAGAKAKKENLGLLKTRLKVIS